MTFKRKRVVIFFHESSLSGANLAILDTVVYLSNQRFDILCVLPQYGSVIEEIIKIDCKIQFHIFTYRWWMSEKLNHLKLYGLRILMRNLLSIYDLNKLLKIYKPDYIVSNSIVINLGPIMAWMHRKKHIWFIHEFGTLDHGFSFNFNSFLAWKFIDKHGGHLIANSKVLADFLNEKVGRSVQYLYCTFEPNKFFYAKKNWNKPYKFIIYGRITESKGHSIVIDAVSILMSRQIPVLLTIMGDCTDDVYMEFLKGKVVNEKLENIVKFLPHNKEPFGVVCNHDFVINCSKMEAFGRMNVEAMLMGLIVIAANAGSSKELFTNGINGFLFERNPTALAKCIEDSLGFNENELNVIRNTARDFAVLNFNGSISKIKLQEIFI